jgi:hypothetical protein
MSSPWDLSRERSITVHWVGRPNKTTIEVKWEEGKSGSKANGTGEVPLSNRDQAMSDRWSLVE